MRTVTFARRSRLIGPKRKLVLGRGYPTLTAAPEREVAGLVHRDLHDQRAVDVVDPRELHHQARHGHVPLAGVVARRRLAGAGGRDVDVLGSARRARHGRLPAGLALHGLSRRGERGDRHGEPPRPELQTAHGRLGDLAVAHAVEPVLLERQRATARALEADLAATGRERDRQDERGAGGEGRRARVLLRGHLVPRAVIAPHEVRLAEEEWVLGRRQVEELDEPLAGVDLVHAHALLVRDGGRRRGRGQGSRRRR